MRVVYMGTPEFAVPALKALAESDADVVMAVTQPDKARNRGKKVQPTPVKEAAEALGIPVVQPEKVKNNPAFIEEVRAAAPDLIVVAAYGKILPKELLEIPPRGCVNIHGSLLPRFRGAAPIQRSILEGDAETGVTLMYMAEGLDTGDMIAKKATSTAGKTAGDLHDELSVMGAELLLELLPALMDGTAPRTPQDDAFATYAPMIFKQDGRVDFSGTPETIERQIRGLAPWPGAFAQYKEETIKFLAAVPLETETDAAPGTILNQSKEGIDVAAGGRILRLTRIQMPGKKPVDVAEFLKGNRLDAEELLR